MSIFTPTNQIRLTNVAVVKLKKAGKRFEVACYKNKVISWRSKIEKDIDEVLQTAIIFSNVSKGQVAKKEDIIKAFTHNNQLEICKEVCLYPGTDSKLVIYALDFRKGELQISDKERRAHLDSATKDIATIISNMCINPQTNKPYTVSMIEKSMKSIHFSVKPNKSNKQQALEVIKSLKKVIEVERSQMKIKLILPLQDAYKIKDEIYSSMSPNIISIKENLNELEMIFFIDPGFYRKLDEMIKADLSNNYALEVMVPDETKDTKN